MTAQNILQAIKYLGDSGDSFLDIEGYERLRFSTEKIHCHHRREITEGKTAQQLIEEGKYYNIPASDLIFLTAGEHTTLHMRGENHPFFGKHHSKATLKKMSEAKKGKTQTEATRQRISEAMKGRIFSEEHTQRLSKALRGKPLSEEHKKKMSESRRGKHWYNNGTTNVWVKVCPAGFVPGMLKI